MMQGPERLRARNLADYSPRPHPDIGQVYNHLHHNAQPYSASNGLGFMANDSYMQYSTLPSTYSAYSPTYSPTSATSQAAVLFPYSSGGSMPYSVQPPPRGATLPSQQRVLSRSYGSSSMHLQHRSSPLYVRPPLDYSAILETEEQDSINRESGHSEPIEPPLEGYPDVSDFDELMKHYVAQLSPKKQDKALINARRAANIRYVLSNKKTTSVESAQFRFWVKKMFQLQPNTASVPMDKRKICHENKPIAVREKLFKILTRAHQKCQHGGRDKTSAQVRKVYSWVPKELISRFVKLCPTCRERRGAVCSTDGGPSPSELPVSLGESSPVRTNSPPERCRSDVACHNGGLNTLEMPTQLMNSSTTFQNQNRWLSGFPPVRSSFDEQYHPTVSFPSPCNFRDLAPRSQTSNTVFQMTNNISQETRSNSSATPRSKYEAQYKYD